jgi:hypothetical protein
VSTTRGAIAAKVYRRLQQWTPEDGEYVDLAVMVAALPMVSPNSWSASLIGEGVKYAAVKRLPLEGRIRASRSVVLVRSLREWLEHYNPDKSQTVERLLEDLTSAQKHHTQHRADMKAEGKLRHGWKTREKQPPKAKPAKPLKVTSKDVFGVWG